MAISLNKIIRLIESVEPGFTTTKTGLAIPYTKVEVKNRIILYREKLNEEEQLEFSKFFIENFDKSNPFKILSLYKIHKTKKERPDLVALEKLVDSWDGDLTRAPDEIKIKLRNLLGKELFNAFLARHSTASL